MVAGLRANRPASQAWQRFAEQTVDLAGILDEQTQRVVTTALAAVPRDRFVEGALSAAALQDNALPIGYGQTISKPSTVARMLGLIDLRRGMRVLEVGCGSGYCSAVMAAAGAEVFAVEYIGLLAQKTRRLLDSMGFYNVLIRSGDGRRGWIEHAPYHAIVVSAAFDRIDEELLDQLVTPGGRLVAPINKGAGQALCLWEAREGGPVLYELEECNFVEGSGI